MKRNIEQVFVTEGVPEFTFVPPPNFNDIFLDIRRPGKPVIIEGQSGTGKTTCVKKVIEKLEQYNPEYLTARDSENIKVITSLSNSPRAGTYVIDDFHRLDEETQHKLANIAKIAAEQGEETELPKLVLIGINQIGSDLIQLVPDIAKRTGIHRISPARAEDIAMLVGVGCKELKITIQNNEMLFDECRGDYWLTQQLCQQICIMNNILETCDSHTEVSFNLVDLRAKVVDRLKSAYYLAVKEFCRGQRFRPSNDPYFKLLKAISQHPSSVIDLNELANATPDVRGSINNIKERRLNDLLQSKPNCIRYFYYNQETKNFAIDDPALFYFLKHLDWDSLRGDCGFRESSKDYDWDVALSFAGEKRELARSIAAQLEVLDVRVFFDEQYEINLLGKALSAVFENIFSETSHFVVCLLDHYHREKIWPTFERQCFQKRVGEGQVIPVFLDDTNFVEIAKEIGGIKFEWNPDDPKWKEAVDSKIVFKLIDLLDQS